MLRHALSQVQRSLDVACVFAELGYLAVDQPLEDDVRIVAKWKAFRVLAAEAPDPLGRSQELARWLAAKSIRGLAAVTGPRSELVLAAPRVGQDGTTKSLTISLTDPTPFALDQLDRLRPKQGTSALTHALKVAEVLRGELVSERFFSAFRAAVERMAGSLGTKGTQADRKLAALLPLTRILFLYFVQSKKWLDGRSDYLRSLLDTALATRRHFHRAFLDPLFFGTLNRPQHRRSHPALPGTIPYLNGGLFEPHAAERSLQVHFANDLWRDTFDDLFERFRFCVRESDAADAIAPDMLGRVFERLMDVGERRDTGSFYTPETVVRQIVDATIESALTEHLSPRAADRVVRGVPRLGKETQIACKVLGAFKVLDPAVGSGAFLLGALKSLCAMRSALDAAADVKRSLPKLRREILRSNLFGVDINPIAVRLAELRLWLAVIADDTTEEIASIAPLPNLDGVVRQGNTLLDPLGAARRFGTHLPTTSDTVTAVRTARQRLFEARGSARRTRQRALRRAESTLARRLLDEAVQKLELAIQDLVFASRGRDLFGRRFRLSHSQRLHHRQWTRLRKEVKEARRQLDQSNIPFFSFEVHAPDVIQDGGFSAVIGNPPWVRSEALPPSLKRVLKERFRWWRGTAERGYRHLPDLSVAFFERCLELTRPGGAVGLLVPSKVASAGYGETARRHLVRETSISYIHRVPDQEAAFGATTYPLAIVVRKRKPPAKHPLRLGFDRPQRVTQAALDTPGPWILVPDAARSALREFTESGIPLKDVAPPSLGVKTGADRILVGRLLRRDDSTIVARFGDEEIMLEADCVRPVIRGRDVRPFTATPSHVLIWGHDRSGNPHDKLPPRAARYLEKFHTRLRKRADYRKGPLWTVFRIRSALAENPVVWPDLAKRPAAVALNETLHAEAVPLNTCYVAAAPDREAAFALAAVMNSTWAMAYTCAAGDEARGGYRRINARLTGNLPLPPLAKRKELATLSAEAHDNRGRIAQASIDEAVATALDLPPRTQLALRSLASHYG